MIIFLFLILFSTQSFAEDIFIYQGDGYLSLINSHNRKKFEGRYRKEDGTYDREALDQINQLFGVPENFGEDVSLRTISWIDYLQDQFAKDKTLTLISAYRSPSYNANLRKKGGLAGKTSYHMEAMAADIVFPNKKSKEVWKFATKLNYGGAGYYSGDAVHLDSGKPRSWTQDTAIDPNEGPPKNKNIYLSIDQDTYHPGDRVRLFFSGVSDYPFGVKPKVVLRGSKEKTEDMEIEWKSKSDSEDCRLIHDRAEARQIFWTVPKDMPITNEKLMVQIEFCKPKYKMPDFIVSREFSIQPSLKGD